MSDHEREEIDLRWCETHRAPTLRVALSCSTFKLKVAAGQVPQPCVLVKLRGVLDREAE